LQKSVRDHELPLRIAYEQLDELAANADKVKTAIEKNRTILNKQVKDNVLESELIEILFMTNASNSHTLTTA
jgi:hypothetical protein